ncbi:MAG: YggS family pyridoxal phosphate-dependent enzyme [Deltaproteobacteria bacterium]|nr:YggS family pyridoxal phosphate-dependent enzyme [Deltaproteobacteria bacterium]
MSVAENLQRVKAQIEASAARSAREGSAIQLVAVSKTFSADDVSPLVELGHSTFGENYAQEGRAKVDLLRERFPDRRLSFHFIGRLQRNKVRDIVGRFDVIQSVDRPELARAIDAESSRVGAIQEICIQVNVSDEPQKGGVPQEAVEPLIALCSTLPALKIIGLMMIGKLFGARENESMVRGEFQQLRELRDRLQRLTAVPLPELSMGMSGDFDWAIEEGATIVRVGSAIFGSRAKAGEHNEIG